ncbi:MAG: NAD-dependent epimerase/dehydratase family protein, partial [Anaerolineales bacterium]
MRIVVTGGTGFIGRALCARLLDLGHAVIVLTRDPVAARRRLDPRITVVRRRDEEPTGEWTGALQGSDAVVNLAGE